MVLPSFFVQEDVFFHLYAFFLFMEHLSFFLFYGILFFLKKYLKKTRFVTC